MQCLIIAAGQGTRLRSLAESKPLAEVAGVPLIEQVIRAAAAGGCSRFLVVTGYRAEQVEAFLAELARSSGLSIETARNSSWDRPNGHSVLAAGDRLEKDFILLMSDHLFDPAIVAALLDRPASPLLLAVDRHSGSELIDLDDATKVAIGRDGEIRRIGKELDEWDAVDTGLFRATPLLAQAIRESLDEGGKGSLSEGVQRLADQGQAATFDATGHWWMDVDDPRAHRLAEEHLAVRGT